MLQTNLRQRVGALLERQRRPTFKLEDPGQQNIGEALHPGIEVHHRVVKTGSNQGDLVLKFDQPLMEIGYNQMALEIRVLLQENCSSSMILDSRTI